MKLKETFNLKPELYDELRPTYSSDLYSELFNYIDLDENSKLVEIGIGTGQATVPFLDKECYITAIELGSDLAKLTAEKFKDYSKLNVVNSDFESYEMKDSSIDMVYSASAFHWINPEIGLPKIYSALKRNGVFAWISTLPCAWKDTEELFNQLQEVYYGFKVYFGAKSKLTLSQVDNKIKNDTQYKRDILEKYNFIDVKSFKYIVKKEFSSVDYIRLLDTYSDHSVIPNNDKTRFYSQIKNVIDENGGRITVVYTNVLVVGRK